MIEKKIRPLRKAIELGPADIYCSPELFILHTSIKGKPALSKSIEK